MNREIRIISYYLKKRDKCSRIERIVVTGNSESNIYIWNKYGEATGILHGHKNWIQALHYSKPNLFSGGNDKHLICWHLPPSGNIHPKWIFTTPKHSGFIKHISRSPSSDIVATGCSNGEVYLWDTRKQNEIGRVNVTSPLTAMICTHESVICGLYNGILATIPLYPKNNIYSPLNHEGLSASITGLLYNNNGENPESEELLVCWGKGVGKWEIKEKELVTKKEWMLGDFGGDVKVISMFTTHGFVTGHKDGVFAIWGVDQGLRKWKPYIFNKLRVFSGWFKWIIPLTKHLFIVGDSYNQKIRIIDMQSNKLIQFIQCLPSMGEALSCAKLC